MFADIDPKGTGSEEIEPDFTQPTSIHRSSLGTCQLFSLAAADMLCNISCRGPPTDKI